MDLYWGHIYDRGDQPLDKEIGKVFAGQRGALQCALNNIRALLYMPWFVWVTRRTLQHALSKTIGRAKIARFLSVSSEVP